MSFEATWPNRTWRSVTLQNTVSDLDIDGAMRSLDRARAILEPLAAANPLAARYQSSLADCYSEIASVQARRQQSGETLVLLEKARAIEKGLIDRYPDQACLPEKPGGDHQRPRVRVLQTGQQRRSAQVVSRGPGHLPAPSRSK